MMAQHFLTAFHQYAQNPGHLDKSMLRFLRIFQNPFYHQIPFLNLSYYTVLSYVSFVSTVVVPPSGWGSPTSSRHGHRPV